jgi:hypothetical protein
MHIHEPTPRGVRGLKKGLLRGDLLEFLLNVYSIKERFNISH